MRCFLKKFCSLPFVSTISEILKVRLGEYDVSTTAEPLRHEEFNITDIVIYPGFNNSTLVHDIALLKLERPAKRKQVKETIVVNNNKSQIEAVAGQNQQK